MNAVAPQQLERLQHAWERVSNVARVQWQRDKEGGEGVSGQNFAKPPAGGAGVHRTFYDIPNFLEQDDTFLELIDLPDVVALVERLCGVGGLQPPAADAAPPTPLQLHHGVAAGFPASQLSPYHGIAQCSGFQARVVPSEGNQHGYIRYEVARHIYAVYYILNIVAAVR